jgi:hypothetical protein
MPYLKPVKLLLSCHGGVHIVRGGHNESISVFVEVAKIDDLAAISWSYLVHAPIRAHDYCFTMIDMMSMPNGLCGNVLLYL